MMQESRDVGSSLFQVTKIRKADEHAGGCTASAVRWVNKSLWLYHQRRLAGYATACHFCLVHDGSIRSIGKDTLAQQDLEPCIQSQIPL
jgi:hypothetical protein